MEPVLKVCHIISGYYRNDARVFYRQCLSLKKNFEVYILTNDGDPNGLQEGVKVISCTRTALPRWKAILFASRYFYKQAIEIDADVYQLHSPELLPLALKLKKNRKKVIYDAHEDMPAHILEKEWLPKWLRGLVSFFFEKYSIYIYKKIDEIISPHSHVILKMRSSINKGILIPNFPLVKHKIGQTELNFISRKNIFCYSGTVYSYSNQEMICEALMYLKNASYKIAGYIEENHKIKILKNEAEEQIEFLGRLNQNDLANFYSNSIAGLVIYDYKLNLGNKVGSYATNKLFEYMEAGLPIICTDYDLWRDIVDRYKCGIYVKPGDTLSLINAMTKIMNDKKSSFEMGQNGRHAVETEFNWKFTEKDYINLYHRITNNL